MEKEIRWVGPYLETDRHADKITLDHLIWLQNELSKLRAEHAKLKSKHQTLIGEAVKTSLSNLRLQKNVNIMKDAMWEILKPKPPFEDEVKGCFTIKDLLDDIHQTKETAYDALSKIGEEIIK